MIDTRVTVAVAAAPLGSVRVTARGRRPVASGNRPVVKDSGRHSGRQLPSRPSVLLTSHNDSLRSLGPAVPRTLPRPKAGNMCISAVKQHGEGAVPRHQRRGEVRGRAGKVKETEEESDGERKRGNSWASLPLYPHVRWKSLRLTRHIMFGSSLHSLFASLPRHKFLPKCS